MKKKLYKSEKDRKICGVCGGIAEFLNLDSTIIRLIWVILGFTYGSGFLIYLICALVMPNESEIEMVIKKDKKKDE